MNKFAEPATTCANPSDLPTLTLDSLTQTVKEFREKHPLAGFNVVESPFIPPGIAIVESRDQLVIANVKTGQVTCANKPRFLAPMPPPEFDFDHATNKLTYRQAIPPLCAPGALPHYKPELP